MSTKHELKCEPGFYEALVGGFKPFEVRLDDGRNFRQGDTLHLRAFEADRARRVDQDAHDGYTGGEATVGVTYVLRNFEGLKPGFVVMGLTRPLNVRELAAFRRAPEDFVKEKR